jgi:hypothetical protein
VLYIIQLDISRFMTAILGMMAHEAGFNL